MVGKNYAYQITSSVDVFFDDKIINPFIGAGALGMVIDEFNGDNFDHSGLGFIGGGYIARLEYQRPPDRDASDAERHAELGRASGRRRSRRTISKSLTIATHGAVMSHRNNASTSIRPIATCYGRPLMRMTFDFTDNEHKMSDYLTDRATEIAKAMKPREFNAKKRTGHYSIVPYQTTHNTGGAIMGSRSEDRASSTAICRAGTCPNLFVMGASAFPQNAGYNPTGTVGALTYLGG